MSLPEFEIDESRYELRRDGDVVAVEPKVFDLICFLTANPNRLVTKDELIDNVWAGRIVSDAALASAVKAARRAIGDDDVKTSRIKTVRGRGFRMDLEAAASATPAANNAPFFVQPSFAVLVPKDANWSNKARHRVGHAMTRVPFVTVAAPRVLDALASLEPEVLVENLGLGFALDLRAISDGETLQLDCTLFDTSTGMTIWSHVTPEFNASTGIDKVLTEISVRLEPQLVRAVYGALSGQSPSTQDPRALALHALGTMSLKGWNRPAFDEAEAILNNALRINPDVAFARGALALIMALGPEVGMCQPSSARREEAIAHADRAIELDGYSPLVLGYAGCALCDAGQGLRGKTVLERALSLDDGNPQAMAALGTQLIREGDISGGISLIRRAIANAPQDNTRAVWRSILAMALSHAGDLDTALAEAKLAVEADDRTHLSRTVLAVVHLARGEVDAAQSAWLDAKRVTPDLTADEMSGLIGARMTAEIRALA